MFWVSPKKPAFDGWGPLSMRVRNFRVTIGKSPVGPVDQDNLIAGCSGYFDRTSPASRQQNRFCRDRLV